jgi:hypothetical protein
LGSRRLLNADVKAICWNCKDLRKALEVIGELLGWPRARNW